MEIERLMFGMMAGYNMEEMNDTIIITDDVVNRNPADAAVVDAPILWIGKREYECEYECENVCSDEVEGKFWGVFKDLRRHS